MDERLNEGVYEEGGGREREGVNLHNLAVST